MSFIELVDLKKRYGEHEVLRGIDLNIEKHQVVTLIGASGCGKSTLLRCINALETIDTGKVLIGGDVVSGPGVDVNRLRKRVGMVFQSYNLFPHMTVLDNVALGPVKLLGENIGAARERARELLDRVNLSHRAEYYPDQLSGGQQQRVAIIRTIAMRPEAMLLDEITSALDPELVSEVLNIVRDLAADGMTMILATHEMQFAREVSDLVVFLEQGRVLEKGPPSQLFGDPVEARTREFLKKIVDAGRL
ncbi:amino acid ABC transporter ATP-binding protein [Burkholderia cenocepacia]|uniref:amino acid ABC transporter ATP-binding protein n=1 Tax=Burkholderia TaxID=32008 RepID=UPI00075B1E2E|nr:MULTISPECIES: amino acid ABC transporter ATP-binding protein [Burkholderia]KVV18275.1 peptide ABC transporter ATP-binding protein [Burkholderia cepacia]MCO8324334.1 amino acid ABC transporter ATP-binding protein [Burkholderia cenocepacia]MCO8333946.1 amino acid ABC transporter ATP-binding protein [Burkholderia cenocepacia]MCO8338904.1 amino acid ABC transporter ATP-binding protein [Burkholderia cenocepacia]MCO8346190.1 amino acid ABC transporter ATP-binding protein [Burkholderia cenocepacia